MSLVQSAVLSTVQSAVARVDGVLKQPLAQRYGGAQAAYSMRDIGVNGGAVVSVRRTSDNTLQDFTATEITDGTLATWVGSGNNGFVSTWYDQSGNNYHATQSTTGRQPKIVDSTNGVVDILDYYRGGGRAFMDISKFLGNGSACTCFAVISNLDNTVEKFYVSNRGGGGGGWNFKNENFDPGKLTLTFIGYGNRTSDDVVVPNKSSTKQLIGFTRVGGDGELYEGGDLLAADSDTLNYDTSIDNIPNNKPEISSIAKQGNSVASHGNELNIGEVIIWDSDVSNRRAEIESDIASYWGITI